MGFPYCVKNIDKIKALWQLLEPKNKISDKNQAPQTSNKNQSIKIIPTANLRREKLYSDVKKVIIDSYPRGAKILADDKFIGYTPFNYYNYDNVTIPPFKLMLKGYYDATIDRILLPSDKNRKHRITMKLEKIPKFQKPGITVYCPAGMVYIPRDYFTMGTDKFSEIEKPQKEVFVSDFCIDRYEYPNEENIEPVHNVDFYNAKYLCETRGKRLCQEIEWEKVCQGLKNVLYSYGNTYESDKCNTDKGTWNDDSSIAKSGEFKYCTNFYGAYDLTGNLWEWTDTLHNTPEGITFIQKGGSWDSSSDGARCTNKQWSLPKSKYQDVGFRCCSAPILQSK